MNKASVFDCNIIQLPRVFNPAGNITAVNNNQEIPFEVQRVYYLYDVPGGEARGGHAHKNLQQLIIAASGSFDITIDDGRVKRTFHISRPYMGLYMPPGLWRELNNFSSGSICLVLASLKYEENDYIRDYSAFKVYKNLDFVKFDNTFLEKSWEWLKDSEIQNLIMGHNFTKTDQDNFWNSLDDRKDYIIKGVSYFDKPIGACGLKNINTESAEYWGYIGEKNLWGKGIGTFMIDFIVNEAQKRGIRKLYLNVVSHNYRAIKCYEKYGFILSKEDEVKTYEYNII